MKKMTIAMIAPVLALKPKATKPAKAPAKRAPVKAKMVKSVKAVKPKAKGELNTDALEAPHAVKGKPHHFQYK